MKMAVTHGEYYSVDYAVVIGDEFACLVTDPEAVVTAKYAVALVVVDVVVAVVVAAAAVAVAVDALDAVMQFLYQLQLDPVVKLVGLLVLMSSYVKQEQY